MMVTQLRHIIKEYLQPSAMVLMYHRIAVSGPDVWDITVHPEVFAEQLQVLKEGFRVIPLTELLARQKRNSLQRNTIAITFDDGYQDNYLVAKPLLEKYGLPATFFIATANTDTANEFWWDELEALVLGTAKLPDRISMDIAGTAIKVSLDEESTLTGDLKEKLRHWRASEQEPETKRSKLFLQLWQALRPLTHPEQQQYLGKIKEWVGESRVDKPKYNSMSSAQLQALVKTQLFEVGSHTITHPLLSSLSKEEQYLELKGNRAVLQEITGQSIDTCSFPYGAYNADSMAVAQQIGFTAAFTTQQQRIHRSSNPFQLGRVQVPNLSKHAFHQLLSSPR